VFDVPFRTVKNCQQVARKPLRDSTDVGSNDLLVATPAPFMIDAVGDEGKYAHLTKKWFLAVSVFDPSLAAENKFPNCSAGILIRTYTTNEAPL